jgi:cell wall-associated NlpC family hydrolase
VGRRVLATVLAAITAALALPAAPAPATPAPSLYTRMRVESAALEELAQRSLENQQRAADLRRRSATAEQAYRAALLRRDQLAEDTAAWAREAYMTLAGPSLVDGLAGRGGPAAPGDRSAELARTDAALRQSESDWQAATTAARALSVEIAADRNAVAVRSANLRAFRRANAAVLARQQAVAAAADMMTYRSRVAAGQLVAAAGPASSTALAAVRVALGQLGKPYVFGAEGPSTYDCSGLVQYAYAYAGIALPRTARPQYRVSRPVPPTQLQPGDLLFFATDRSNWQTIHHVGIYLGGGRMVHAPTTGDVVRIAPVWWAEFFGAGRVA